MKTAKKTVSKIQISETEKKDSKYVLKLYIAGLTVMSMRAIENLKKLCKTYLAEGYEMEILDIRQNPIYAKNGQIVAAPTLIKELPLPLRKFIGDMSNTDKLLVGLDLKSIPDPDKMP